MKRIECQYEIDPGRCAESPTGVALRGPADAARESRGQRWSTTQEEFRVVLLDARHRVVQWIYVSKGTLSASMVHPRDVFRAAVKKNASAIMLFHNHPSGDTSPSNDDLALTRRLVTAGDILGIQVIDHIILSGTSDGWLSIREYGWPDSDETSRRILDLD